MTNIEPRFWILAALPTADEYGFDTYPYGGETVGIVDEAEGGIVAYVHADNAERFLTAIRAYEKEEN